MVTIRCATTVALNLLTMSLWLGCGKAPAPQSADAGRLENADLGIAIASLPEPFELESNEGTTLELTTSGTAGQGSLSFELGQQEIGGVNLVAKAEGRQAWFEGQPQGQYFGSLELMTPLGPAYTARGSYQSEAGKIEELIVFTLHPAENRALQITYRYPPGEGRERMQQLADLLGELEPFQPSDQEASSSAAES